jgi:hypothetical protein
MYDMALDKESKHHPARLKKGKMLLKMDKIEEARVEFQHIIENSPEDPIAKEAQASMAS